MIVAIAGMVTGRPSARAGWALRAVALACLLRQERQLSGCQDESTHSPPATRVTPAIVTCQAGSSPR